MVGVPLAGIANVLVRAAEARERGLPLAAVRNA